MKRNFTNTVLLSKAKTKFVDVIQNYHDEIKREGL